MDYDAIVIGTGFGATVAATRLVEKGKRILILERGTWWLTPERPPANGNGSEEGFGDWLRENDQPIQYFLPSDQESIPLSFYSVVRSKRNKAGLYNFSRFKQAYVITASGVGGGSLIYSNVNSLPPAEVLRSLDLSLGQAEFHAARVWMESYRGKFNHIVTKVPLPGRDVSDLGPDSYLYLDRSRALKEAAGIVSRKLGIKARWAPLNLSVIEYDAQRGTESESATAHTFCERQGRCILGCLPAATHSLDKTLYRRLFANPKLGATLWPYANVRYIKAVEGGFEVSFEDYRDDGKWKTVKAPSVFLGAGTLGTNEILLRSREMAGLQLSDKLGERFSTNGNFGGFAVGTKSPVYSTRGPVNTCGVEIKLNGFNITVEDCGIPGPFAHATDAFLRVANDPAARRSFRGRLLLSWASDAMPDLRRMRARPLNGHAAGAELFSNTFFFSVAAQDDASGKLRLYRNGIDLDWAKPISKHPVFESIETLLRSFSEAMGGRYVPFPMWQGFSERKLMVVHPLGGCPIGRTISDGVVDEFGRVFDGASPAGSALCHRGLYIVDASVIPGSLATNPVLTITAQAIKTVTAALAETPG